jgi:thymidylate synthase
MTKTTADIRDVIAAKYVRNEFVTDKTGARTVEIVGASFNADAPTIYGALNDKYIEQELDWYLSQSLLVADIGDPVPKIWKQVADSDGKINSNYGYLIFSEENHVQYDCVLNELLSCRDSRRAVMIYTRPTMHADYCAKGMSDFICTNAVQYLIRDGRLHAIVQMRSNDIVFGYRNDYAWQKYVQDRLVRDYNGCLQDPSDEVTAGDITWQVGSLHVYERHFSLIEDYIVSLQEP